MQGLFRAQQRLDEKERQLEACQKKYEKFMRDLKE